MPTVVSSATAQAAAHSCAVTVTAAKDQSIYLFVGQDNGTGTSPTFTDSLGDPVIEVTAAGTIFAPAVALARIDLATAGVHTITYTDLFNEKQVLMVALVVALVNNVGGSSLEGDLANASLHPPNLQPNALGWTLTDLFILGTVGGAAAGVCDLVPVGFASSATVSATTADNAGFYLTLSVGWVSMSSGTFATFTSTAGIVFAWGYLAVLAGTYGPIPSTQIGTWWIPGTPMGDLIG